MFPYAVTATALGFVVFMVASFVLGCVLLVIDNILSEISVTYKFNMDPLKKLGLVLLVFAVSILCFYLLGNLILSM